MRYRHAIWNVRRFSCEARQLGGTISSQGIRQFNLLIPAMRRRWCEPASFVASFKRDRSFLRPWSCRLDYFALVGEGEHRGGIASAHS